MNALLNETRKESEGRMRERRKREREREKERERERENTPPAAARTAPRHLVSDTRPRRRRRGVSDTH